MSRDVEYCFAADLGGTKLAAAVADSQGRILAESTEPTDPGGAQRVVQQLVACAHRLARDADFHASQLRHVMVGLPGAVDPRTGRVSLVPNIAGLEQFDVLGFLRGHFGPGVAIDNDVNLAMLGEHAQGCARGCSNAAFLALGTGAGLGLLIDGQLFRGPRGAAGEIADLPLTIDPTSLLPIAHSTFEGQVGSHAIVNRYRSLGGTAATTVRDVFSLLEHGDDVATSVLNTTAHWVAFGVVTLQSLLDLELIVFGGSIGVQPELYERVQLALPALLARPIAIAPSQLGDRAGLIGAVWAAAKTLRQSPQPVKAALPLR